MCMLKTEFYGANINNTKWKKHDLNLDIGTHRASAQSYWGSSGLLRFLLRAGSVFLRTTAPPSGQGSGHNHLQCDIKWTLCSLFAL